jgi:two-component system, response regulator PdtaR
MEGDTTVILNTGPLSNRPVWWRELALAVEGAGSGAQSGERDRILIVEDDLLVASQMEAALADAGFGISGVATTASEALQLAEAESPTLVVMDIRLADDGDGVNTALELFRLHGIRCIFASAHSDQEARQRAAPACPLGWLQKPYTMASLTDTVRAAFSELRTKN